MVRHGKTYRKGPKRPISRRMAELSFIADTSVNTFILHTSKEKETLIRTIIQLMIKGVANSGVHLYEMLIAIAPGGTSLSNANLATGLDGTPRPQEIFRHKGIVGFATDFSAEAVLVEKDIKAQRKLQNLDQLQLTFIADDAVALRVTGIIIQFFKQ